MLAQVDDDGNECMVACASRSLNKHERNYSSYRGECLAEVWACRLFKHFVHGLHFTLVTDHEPLKWLMGSAVLEGAHARWACILKEFDMTIVHRAGSKHQNVDALSRLPLPSDVDKTGARLDHDCTSLMDGVEVANVHVGTAQTSLMPTPTHRGSTNQAPVLLKQTAAPANNLLKQPAASAPGPLKWTGAQPAQADGYTERHAATRICSCESC